MRAVEWGWLRETRARGARGVIALSIVSVVAGCTKEGSPAPLKACTPIVGGKRHAFEGTLPRPTGRYATGTQLRRLTDPNRSETSTPAPQDKRSILLQLWYPATVGDTPASAFMPTALGDALIVSEAGWSTRVGTHSRWNAAPASGSQRFPVVLASHGLGTSSRVHTSLYEELASRGYVVAALEHPHDAALTIFPDGTRVGFDSPAALALAAMPSTPTAAEQEALNQRLDAHLDVWVRDLRFALDELTSLNANDPSCLLTGRLDLERVGVFGHSYGGAASHQVMHRDARFDVGVNIDGKPFGPGRHQGGSALTRPFMFVATTKHLTERPSPLATLDVLDGAGYVAVVSNVEHAGLTDLKAGLEVLWGTSPTLDALYGSLDSGRAVGITRSYVGAMFDHYLRDEPAPLLHGASATFPEVRLSIKNPQSG